MNQFKCHNLSLIKYFDSIFDGSESSTLEKIVSLDAIDGYLREYLSIEDMKEAGSFFTGQKLATHLINSLSDNISDDSIVLDPTCGAGNLLLECSRQLTINESLSETLIFWGRVLRGFDIHDSFVEAAKLRIIFEALRRGAKKDCSLHEAFEYLPYIYVRDAMNITADELENITHVVFNPPFSLWESPKINYWKNGKINAAGILFDLYIRILPQSCSIAAILPDVLRSGTRYSNFRSFVSKNINGVCSIWGVFNSKTDVDVFLITGRIEYSDSIINWYDMPENYTPLSEKFDVCVGPLVAYRDPEEGNLYPFIHQKNSPQWKVVSKITEFRRFKGKVIKSPFVVVKRTSAPYDQYRASATIILVDKPVAVENHMIVIQPKSGSVDDCNMLMNLLKSERTNDFLNNRIRLRHLTVGVIKEIPI